jgi:hypothetical protein
MPKDLEIISSAVGEILKTEKQANDVRFSALADQIQKKQPETQFLHEQLRHKIKTFNDLLAVYRDHQNHVVKHGFNGVVQKGISR